MYFSPQLKSFSFGRAEIHVDTRSHRGNNNLTFIIISYFDNVCKELKKTTNHGRIHFNNEFHTSEYIVKKN